MASQVLSGASNPTYTNNTGQNVRVVINYMKSLRSVIGTARVTLGSVVQNRSIFRESLVINWAGVSAGYTQDGRRAPGGRLVSSGPSEIILQPIRIVIGRNLSYVNAGINNNNSVLPVDFSNNATGSFSYSGNPDDIFTLAQDGSGNVDNPNIEGPNSDIATEPYAFPTEIILAPGQTFSAVCGVYNIVVIPEAG